MNMVWTAKNTSKTIKPLSYTRWIALATCIALLWGCGSGSDRLVEQVPEPAPTPTPTPPPVEEVPAEPVFTHLGLSGLIIKKLTFIEARLYAATDAGIYTQAEGNRWELITEADWDIHDFVAKDASHFIASHQYRGQQQISETLDGGATWETIRGGFGGPEVVSGDREAEPAFKLLHDGELLYASGYDALAVSSDDGQSWEKLVGLWNGFARGTSLLAKDMSQQEVWYGGQGAFENPVLRKYSIKDSSLFEVGSIDEVLPVPSTVKAMQFSALVPGRVYVSGEGGIVYSDDSGESWKPLRTNEDSRFYFDFALFSDGANETFYTGGWTKNFDNPQALVVEVSRDSGATWESFEYDDPELLGGVYSLTSISEGETDTLFLGLYKGGVMQVEFVRP